ncbi:MAG: VCBS repeat-containing protein [Planctomycetota bacterium]
MVWLGLAGSLRGQDECATALPIAAGVTVGTTATATTSSVTGTCGAPMGNDLWYAYEAPRSTTVTASLCPAAGGSALFDACLAAFSGPCGAPTEIACSDDHCGTSPEIAFSVEAGETYFLAVGGSRGQAGFFALSLREAPVHDECDGALPIAAGFTVGTNVGASRSAPTGTCGVMGSDVWYAFTATVDDSITASLCVPGAGAGFGAALAVFSGPCTSLVEIACDDNGRGSGPEVTFAATAGQTYHIAVGGANGAQGTFTMALFGVPTNDECTTATSITGGAAIGTTLGATPSIAAASCAAGGGDVWFAYTAPSPGLLTASLCPTAGGSADFDTVLAVFSGDCGALVELACNDDVCGAASAVTLPVVSGQTYLMSVGGAAGERGSFRLALGLAAAGDDCAAPLPITEGITAGANFGATTSGSVASCGAMGSDVWYEYTPMDDGLVTASFCAPGAGADFDTVLAVFDTCSGATLTCNDDHCGAAAEVTFGVRAGQPYLIAVGGNQGEQGTYRLWLRSSPLHFQFDELGKRTLPRDQAAAVDAALCDVNADGAVDLFVVDDPGSLRLLLNDGLGGFDDVTGTHLPVSTVATKAIDNADIDGDGDLDLVLGNAGQDQLYVNDGTGVFTDVTAASLPSDLRPTQSVVCIDVEGDGDLDLALGDLRSPVRLYLNDGNGAFADVSAARLPTYSGDPTALAAVDADGDGDADLVVGHSGYRAGLYVNDGAGSFVDETEARLPDQVEYIRAVAARDVDADGDLDLVFGALGTLLYLNDGTGVFHDATAAQTPAYYDDTHDIACLDVDADGDDDIVVANVGGSSGQPNRLFRNNGAGMFTDATAGNLPQGQGVTPAVAHGDVDGDGDPDLVTANGVSFAGHQDRLYLNDGTGTFIDADRSRLPIFWDRTDGLACCDVDGDSDLDLVIAGDGPNRLLLNDGSGYFDEAGAPHLSSAVWVTCAAVSGDLDGDGDQDLVFGNRLQQNRLFLNDGAGRFVDVTSSRMPADNDATHALACCDVDRDGDLDLVIGNQRQQNRLYLNDGTAMFVDATSARMPMDLDGTEAVTCCDVDGDGDHDLVCGNAGGVTPDPNRLYLNDGMGTFRDVTANRMPRTDGDTVAIVAADVDGDGDLDLVLGNDGFPVAEKNLLFINDGTGRFADESARLPGHVDDTRALSCGDLDGDGDLDLVIGNHGSSAGQQNRVYANDGAGRFTDVTATLLPPSLDATRELACADLDNDGDFDVVSGSRYADRIMINLLRQLEAPDVARPGRSYRLEVYARNGPPRLLDLAVVFVGGGRASIVLPPWGTFGLDPTQAVALPAFLIPQPEGVGSVSLTMPRSSAFIGLPVYSQALIGSFPTPSRLSSVILDVILGA